MALVEGFTGTVVEVDAIPKAMRVILYDANGNPMAKPPVGSFLAPVNIRHTSAAAANTTVWALRNGTGVKVKIRRITLSMGFDGTAVAATTLRYGVQRFATSTPTGGTVIVPIKKDTTLAAPQITDLRFADTGLTTTGVTFEPDMMVIGLPISLTSGMRALVAAFNESMEAHSRITLNANEGIAIRLTVAAVIGLSLNGFIAWDEEL